MCAAQKIQIDDSLKTVLFFYEFSFYFYEFARPPQLENMSYLIHEKYISSTTWNKSRAPFIRNISQRGIRKLSHSYGHATAHITKTFIACRFIPVQTAKMRNNAKSDILHLCYVWPFSLSFVILVSAMRHKFYLIEIIHESNWSNETKHDFSSFGYSWSLPPYGSEDESLAIYLLIIQFFNWWKENRSLTVRWESNVFRRQPKYFLWRNWMCGGTVVEQNYNV